MTKHLLDSLRAHFLYTRRALALAERLYELIRDGTVTEIEQRVWFTASSGIRQDVLITGPGYSFNTEQWAYSSGQCGTLDAALAGYTHRDAYDATNRMRSLPAIGCIKNGDVRILKLTTA